ncbi:MAG: VWA domain-containing protein [Akkermansiaceae bacterium]|nr:VWA domain-containing protein [Akkermansiaceae bacterium]
MIPHLLSPSFAAATSSSRELMWAAPAWLWALLVVLPLLLLRRKTGTAAGIDHPTLRFLSATLRPPRERAGRLGPIFLALAAAALILALAQPCWRTEYEEQKVSGIDIMIACDLSGSMSIRDMVFAGQDDNGRPVRATVDRLRAAKHVINAFIAGRPNDRIGLVAFAGKAKLCSPLTLDHSIVSYIIDQFYLAEGASFGREAHAGYISEDGTAIGTAIAAAATRLHERKETKSKVIILVTDGVNNMGSLSPTDAAKQAAQLGIKIFPIAIGRDERISRYTADVDTFDEKTLREIAKLTGGRFFRADSGAQLQQAFASIDRMEKTDATRRRLVHHEPLFLYPLTLALLLLLAGTGLSFLLPRPAP